jgi:prepilin-type N-terminal cleavage/methylation domain-containing protein
MDMFLRRSGKGFTIIELVMVIMLISVSAIVVNIKWPGTSLNLGALTEQLANDLRFTQALSMTQGQRYCLTIASNTYQIVNSATGAAVVLAFGNSTVILGSGITFSTIVPANTALFIFDGNGASYYSTSTTCNAATAAAATALTTSASISLTASGQTRTILISPETGRVITP